MPRIIPTAPARTNVLGVGISVINQTTAREILFDAVRRGKRGYVAVTGVHGVTEAQGDPAFRDILNHALLCTPDGMPMVWMGKLDGRREMARVYGPDLMLNLCEHSVGEGFTHFFYGGNPGVADDLKRTLENRFPGLQVVGTYCPPFRPLDAGERADLQAVVAELRPDFFWVGLSTPKQEKFMAEYLPVLRGAKIFLGVGAAFDMHTGRTKQAPRWMQRSGLEWFYRLTQEPKRLARRYLVNNPLFVGRAALQLTGKRNTHSIRATGIRPVRRAEEMLVGAGHPRHLGAAHSPRNMTTATPHASDLPATPVGSIPPAETLAVCLLALVPILVKLLCYPGYPGSDDAFIHLTIIRNVTHGLGWGINPAEPINLSSSPLYTTLVAGLNLCGCTALAAGEWLSALAGFGAIVFLHRLLAVLGLRPVSRLAGTAAAAFNLYLWRWDGVVMETSLGLCLLTLACLAYHRASLRSGAWRYLLAGGAAGLATLTRFELGLVIGCFGLREIAVHRADAARWLSACVLLGVGFVAVVAPWFAFCQVYFHLMLPTTFYAKTSHGLLLWNPAVAAELFKVTASSEVIPLLGVFLLLAGAWRRGRLGALEPALFNGLDLFLFPLLLTLFYYLKTPSLESAARYFLPALHLLAAALACLLDALAEGVPAAFLRPAVTGFVLAHALLALGFNQFKVAPVLSRFKENYWSTAQNAAEVLRGRAPAGRKLNVLVEVDIGMLSYYAGDRCYFFDGGALATPSLRGLTLSQQVARTRPDVVIETLGGSVGPMSAQVPGLVEVWHRPFHSHSLTHPSVVYVCNIYENRS